MGYEAVAFVSGLSKVVNQLFHTAGTFGHKSFVVKADSTNEISDMSAILITSFEVIKNILLARFLGQLGLYVADMYPLVMQFCSTIAAA